MIIILIVGRYLFQGAPILKMKVLFFFLLIAPYANVTGQFADAGSVVLLKLNF